MFNNILDFRWLENNSRWDSEFYHTNYQDLIEALRSKGGVPLRSFASEACRGVGPNYDPGGSIRVINSVNVRDLEISDERESWVTRHELDANPNAAVDHGNLIITSTGIGTLGRTFCNLTNETFLADGHITIVRLKDASLAPYITAFLQSPLGRAQFIQRRRGSSRQVEIYPDDILEVLVPPLPSIAHHIASKWLEAVKDVVTSQRLYPEAEEDLLAELQWHTTRQSRSRNTFSEPIGSLHEHNRLDPEFFSPRFVLMDEVLRKKRPAVFSEFVAQHIKGTQPSAYSNDGGVIVIKSKDVVKTGISIDTCDRANGVDLESDRGEVQPNVLLTNMTGVGTLGRAGVVPRSAAPMVISVDVAGWRLKAKLLSAEYLALFLNSSAGMFQSLRHQIGSSGQLHLYPEHVLNFKIFVRRTKSGELDHDWHNALTQKVHQAGIKRRAATAALNSIHGRFASLIGVRPKIYRE
jgi:hypothetical protein